MHVFVNFAPKTIINQIFLLFQIKVDTLVKSSKGDLEYTDNLLQHLIQSISKQFTKV